MTRLLVLALLWPTLAGAVLPARDDFNRATLGANWTQVLGTANCTIVGSAALTADATAEAACFWNADTPTTASYACALLAGTSTGPSSTGVCLAMDAVSGGDAVCCQTDHDIGGWDLVQITAGILPPPLESDTAPTFSAGDYIGIQRTSATAFQCYRSTDGFTWTALGTGVTTTAVDPGALGANISTSASFTEDLWEGGNGTLPTDHLCGTTEAPPTTSTSTSTSTAPPTTTSSSTSTIPATTTTSTTTLPLPTTTTQRICPLVTTSSTSTSTIPLR